MKGMSMFGIFFMKKEVKHKWLLVIAYGQKAKRDDLLVSCGSCFHLPECAIFVIFHSLFSFIYNELAW